MAKARMLLAGSILMCTLEVSISLPIAEARTGATATVQNVRYWSATHHARVIIAIDLDARYENARLTGPDRVYVDISNAKLSSDFQDRTIPVGDEFLKQVRVAQNRSDVVRVVLDVSSAHDYSVFELHDPFRVVIDFHGRSGSRAELDSVSQAPKSRPDEMGDKPALKQNPGGGEAVGKDPEPSAPPETNRLVPSDPVVEPKTGNPAVVATATGVSPPAPTEPSAQPAEVVPAQPDSAGQIVDMAGLRAPQTNLRQEDRPTGPEMPLTISGTLSSGFYNSYTRGGGNPDQRISFVPAGATFDINGYYLTPDLLDYWIQPEVNAGAQASDAGFEGGNGVRMRVSLLRRQALPLTFRYSNMQLKDVFFGSLSQVSSYTQKNRNRDLGLTAELKHAGLPTATIDWGTSSVNSQSGIAGIPDYNSHSNHLNLDSSYQRWGWEFRGFAGRQQQTSDLFAPLVQGGNSSVLQQNVMQYRGSLRRDFMRDSELDLEGGSQSTGNVLLNQPIDLTTRYANANLRMFQRRRWKSSLHAGYTSNIAGLVLTRLAGGLSTNGSIAPDSSVLLPFRHSISYLNLNSLTSLDLSHGFGLYGSLDRTAVLAASDGALSSRYLTTAGGATYSHTFRWGSLSGQYGRSFGIGSVTGLAGRIEGQNYLITAQPGKWERAQFDFSVRGTDQRVRNEQPANEHSFASEGSIGLRVLGQFRTRLGGGWQQGYFTNGGSDFHTDGYTARAGIEHPRFQVSGSLNSSIGNSLEAYGQILGEIGLGSALLSPVHLIPSDFRGMTLTLHAYPLRRLELTALWTRSVQHLQGVVANDFEIIDVYLTFHFRKLQLTAGYFDSTQIYTSYLATYPETLRGRLYIRITRTVKFL